MAVVVRVRACRMCRGGVVCVCEQGAGVGCEPGIRGAEEHGPGCEVQPVLVRVIVVTPASVVALDEERDGKWRGGRAGA